MAVIAVTPDLGQELVSLVEMARSERLSLSLYRFAAREQVVLEAYPASDFRVQHEGALEEVVRQTAETIAVFRPQVEDTLDGRRLADALLRLLAATSDLTVFVNFLHPAGSEYSARVEVLRPEPLEVVVTRLDTDPIAAIEGALEALMQERPSSGDSASPLSSAP